MKMLSLSFYLFLNLLFLVSCTTPVEKLPPETAANDDGVIHFYTEYEGVASMSRDLSKIVISSSDQPEREGYIELEWVFGEHIYFVSEQFEFDVPDCEIFGNTGCEQYIYNVKTHYEEKEGKDWIYFEPADEFWQCLVLTLENCGSGDEVFLFHLMAREKRS